MEILFMNPQKELLWGLWVVMAPIQVLATLLTESLGPPSKTFTNVPATAHPNCCPWKAPVSTALALWLRSSLCWSLRGYSIITLLAGGQFIEPTCPVSWGTEGEPFGLT